MCLLYWIPSLFEVNTFRHFGILNSKTKSPFLTGKLSFWTIFCYVNKRNSQIKSLRITRAACIEFLFSISLLHIFYLIIFIFRLYKRQNLIPPALTNKQTNREREEETSNLEKKLKFICGFCHCFWRSRTCLNLQQRM